MPRRGVRPLQGGRFREPSPPMGPPESPTWIRREFPGVCSEVAENRRFLPKLFAAVDRFPKMRPQPPNGFSF